MFAGACLLLLVWQCRPIASDNLFHARLLDALFDGSAIVEADIVRAASGTDDTASWMAGQSIWLRTGVRRSAVAVWSARPAMNAELLGVVAQQEWWRGNERRALDNIRMALVLQPQHSGLTDTLGAWRTARRELAQLLDDTETILARAPRNAVALAHHGWAQHGTGNFAGARATLEQAAAIAPGERVVLRRLSRFLIETGGDLTRAERLLLQGDRHWPEDDFFYYQLAQLYASQRRLAEAEPYMRRLASLRRNDASAREVVGLYWYERHNFGAALDHYRAAALLEPHEPRFRVRVEEASARLSASSKETEE